MCNAPILKSKSYFGIKYWIKYECCLLHMQSDTDFELTIF